MQNQSAKTHGWPRWLSRLVGLVWRTKPDADDFGTRLLQASLCADDRWIVCAALRLPSGRVICGPRHFDSVMRMQIANDTEAKAWKVAEQGFVDQQGRFLTREHALKYALANGQRRKRCGGDATRLFSENLY